MQELTILILVWLFSGSIGCNFLWVLRYKQDIYKKRLKAIDCGKGLLLALLLGPLIFLFLTAIVDKENKK